MALRVPVFDVSPCRPCSDCKWKMIVQIPDPALEGPAGFLHSCALPGQNDIFCRTNDITYKRLCDVNLRCSCKHVAPFQKTPPRGSAVFSLPLLTPPCRCLCCESCLAKPGPTGTLENPALGVSHEDWTPSISQYCLVTCDALLMGCKSDSSW